MLKKEISQLTHFFLRFFYSIFSATVYISKGNNFLIRKKLKIGIILLSLSTFVACKTHRTTCYKTSNSDKKNNKDSITNNNNNVIDEKTHPPPTCYAPPPPKK